MTLTAQQMEIRRTRIGGSEIGAILGIDPHKTALDVLADKTLPPEERDAPHLTWGQDVEAAILNAHARNEKLAIERPGTLVNELWPHVCATPDGIGRRSNGSRVVLEAKNSQWHQAHRWGEAGTDDAPLLYVAQVTIELGLARACLDVEDTADLIASIGGAPPVVYRIRFDEELFENLSERAERFIRDHVVGGQPIEGWEAMAGAGYYLRRKFPAHDAELLPATEEDLGHLSIIRTMSATAEAAAAEVEAAKNKLKARIGEHAGIASVATWKKCKDTTAQVTDWQAVALRIAEDHGVKPHSVAALAVGHTRTVVTKAGSRRFVPAKEK